MQFEQQPELNKYVDATIPLTWTVRWKALKPTVPLLLCGSLFPVEWLAFRLWLSSRDLGSEWPLLVTVALLPLVLIVAAFEVQVRIGHRTRRKLLIDEKRIILRPAKYNRLSLNRVRGWRLEPVDAPDLSKLTLQYSLDKKGKTSREWSMVLRPEQERALLAEVEHLRQLGMSDVKVVRLAEPMVRQIAKRTWTSAGALALGMYLLVHGMPLLAAGVSPSSGDSSESHSTSKWTVEQKERFRKFVLGHFATLEEFRRFMLITGVALTTVGAGFYLWGMSNIKRATMRAPNQNDLIVTPSR